MMPEEQALVGTEALRTIIERAPPDGAEWLLKMVRHYRDEFRRVAADPEINSESIADGVHRLVDEQIASFSRPIRTPPGSSAGAAARIAAIST